MYYCEKCKVNVTGIMKQCPLCQGDLTGEADNNIGAFPNIPLAKKKRRLFIKILALCSVIAIAICFAVNSSFNSHGWWLNFVLAGIASFWLIFGVIAKKRCNIINTIFWLNCVISLLVLLWDFATGFAGWSVSFVLPFLYILSICLTMLLSACLRLKSEEYLFYFVLNILFGMIPLVLIVFEIPKVVYPSAICAAVAIIAFAVLVIFREPALKEELERRLHI